MDYSDPLVLPALALLTLLALGLINHVTKRRRTSAAINSPEMGSDATARSRRAVRWHIHVPTWRPSGAAEARQAAG